MPERIILKPAGIPMPDPDFTPGIRYGKWVFTSGISAADYATGFVPAATGNPAIPLAGEDSMILQARAIMTMLDIILRAGGTDLQQGARIDQFPTTRAMLDPYHVARREMIDPPRPGSTSVQIANLLCPAATSQIELLAIVPEDGFRKEGISADIPQPLAGYSPALRVGDWVFLSGQVPTDWRNGIAPEAVVDPRFWEGNSIDREARFTLKNLKLTLEAAGSSLANVVKATVHLADINDIPDWTGSGASSSHQPARPHHLPHPQPGRHRRPAGDHPGRDHRCRRHEEGGDQHRHCPRPAVSRVTGDPRGRVPVPLRSARRRSERHRPSRRAPTRTTPMPRTRHRRKWTTSSTRRN